MLFYLICFLISIWTIYNLFIKEEKVIITIIEKNVEVYDRKTKSVSVSDEDRVIVHADRNRFKKS